MGSRRILITGLSTYWGGRLAQELEEDPSVEVIVGVDSKDPTVELERTEFVRIGTQHALIRRIVQAAEIDTVIDTRLVVDAVWMSPRDAHENNVIGTMNILAACGGPESTVEKFVFKSSGHYYGCHQDDPAYFTEEMERPHPPSTPIEKDIVEAERAVLDFADKNPALTVTVLRFANGLGGGLPTSHHRLFSLPVVPTIFGFDPRYQFIHEDDLVGALLHAARNDLDGIYNGAADGVLALTEVIGLLGKQPAPILPPWGTGLVAGQLARTGLRIPSEMLPQLRFGRGLDNRRLKAAGYKYRYTTRETVIKLREHMRISPLLRGGEQPYQYEQEVEEFLRWSPSVRVTGERAGKGWRPSPQQVADLQKVLTSLSEAPDAAGSPSAANGGDKKGAKASGKSASKAGASAGSSPAGDYDELNAREVIALLPSLEGKDLRALKRHEAGAQKRKSVLSAIDRLLDQAKARAEADSS